MDVYKKFVEWCQPTQTPTQKLKRWFFRFSSQEIGSSMISLEMIFEALRSELFRFKFHILSSKILKFSEFNLLILDDPYRAVRWSLIKVLSMHWIWMIISNSIKNLTTANIDFWWTIIWKAKMKFLPVNLLKIISNIICKNEGVITTKYYNAICLRDIWTDCWIFMINKWNQHWIFMNVVSFRLISIKELERFRMRKSQPGS